MLAGAKKIIDKGKEDGFIEYKFILENLPKEINEEGLSDILEMIQRMGFEIKGLPNA